MSEKTVSACFPDPKGGLSTQKPTYSWDIKVKPNSLRPPGINYSFTGFLILSASSHSTASGQGSHCWHTVRFSLQPWTGIAETGHGTWDRVNVTASTGAHWGGWVSR